VRFRAAAASGTIPATGEKVDAMEIAGLDHVTIRCRPSAVPAMVEFYRQALGIEPGARPDFAFPGAWLWLHGRPVVHIAARLPEDGGPPPGPGPIDHVAFRGRGLEAARARLGAAGLAFEEAPVPGFPLHQLFLRDPAGARLELTFEVPERS
jgi:catechol 2,3-dioxygenase-like lactoylglutathione lyase family enzyme